MKALGEAVNYSNQIATLREFFEGDSKILPGKLVGASQECFQVSLQDLFDFLRFDGGASWEGSHKHFGLISTLLHNGTRGLRLIYEVTEQLMWGKDEVGESAESAAARVGNLIRSDEKLPAIYRAPYTISLSLPSSWESMSLHSLRSCNIGHLLSVLGLVSRVTSPRPLIVVAVYQCESCRKMSYHHVESSSFLPRRDCEAEPVCKKKKNTLRLSPKDSRFVHYQEVWIQELPANVPSGKVPHQLKLILRGKHLCNQIRPGRTIRATGVYTLQWSSNPSLIGGGKSLQSHYPVLEVQEFHELNASHEDAAAVIREADLVRQMMRQGHLLYECLAQNLAPAIHGHENVKKALILQLVGGVEVTDKVRGSIHVLLVGDPGIAKSQLLLRMGNLAVRSKYTCGRGASGVGLTACVVKDGNTGEFSLEAGATVLSDLGVCCIDEFDKMGEQDRTAIHEVMEQQTVSISKAGIVATLNARTSILAAANPVGGRYNVEKSIMENVGLPAALMSRFDFIFLMLDQCTDRSKDVEMARHLLSHPQSAEASGHVGTAVVRELVAQAKGVKPYLPRDLHEEIVRRYVSARNSGQHDSYVTARTLTGLLRVSQALAKLRFDARISLEDIVEAERLLQSSKQSVTARRLEKRFEHVNTRYLAAKTFLVDSTAPGQQYEYEALCAQATQTGRTDAHYFDLVLNDLVSEGGFAFTDVSCAVFRRN